MTTRDTQLLALRPDIANAQPELATKPIEKFQHTTLRPILKLQNDLLVATFLQYAKKRKNIFETLNIRKQKDYIEQALQKDHRLREWLFGLLAGQFTQNEWIFYFAHESEIRKRTTSMLIQRLTDQLT